MPSQNTWKDVSTSTRKEEWEWCCLAVRICIQRERIRRFEAPWHIRAWLGRDLILYSQIDGDKTVQEAEAFAVAELGRLAKEMTQAFQSVSKAIHPDD